MNFFLKNFTILLVAIICGIGTLSAQELSQKATEKSALAKSENKEQQNPIFEKYEWLAGIVDAKSCAGEKIEVYQSNNKKTYYAIIEKDNKRVMYDVDGKVYCTNSDKLKCEEFYELKKAKDTWVCVGNGATSQY